MHFAESTFLGTKDGILCTPYVMNVNLGTAVQRLWLAGLTCPGTAPLRGGGVGWTCSVPCLPAAGSPSTPQTSPCGRDAECRQAPAGRPTADITRSASEAQSTLKSGLFNRDHGARHRPLLVLGKHQKHSRSIISHNNKGNDYIK